MPPIRAMFALLFALAVGCSSAPEQPTASNPPCGCGKTTTKKATVAHVVDCDGGAADCDQVVTPFAAPLASPKPPFVPVLLFHSVCLGTCAPNDTYGVTQADFATLVGLIGAAGYTTIGSADYVRAIHGDRTGLPPKPILLTFDDGRHDAYEGADPVLRAANAVATMFVITDEADQALPAFMGWPSVVEASASGRWDIQLHAASGHVEIPVSLGATSPFFANLRFDPLSYAAADQFLEPHALWTVRVHDDLTRGIAALRAHLGTFEPRAFAVPYSDYGQARSNDPTIRGELRALLDATFPVWFTQSSEPEREPVVTHERSRYLVKLTTEVNTVMTWLDESSTR